MGVQNKEGALAKRILLFANNEIMERYLYLRYFTEVTSELQAFADNIDWTPFHRFLLDEYEIDSELETGFEIKGVIGMRIRCVNDLCNQCGVLGKIHRSIRLESSSSKILFEILSYNEEKYRRLIDEGHYRFAYEDIDAILGPITLSATMDLQYQCKDGLRNSTTLFTCQYTEAGGWAFKKAYQ